MSSIDLSYFERLCLLGYALNPELLPLCIQGWSIPAGPYYRARYVEIRDDNLIAIPLNDEGEPDEIQIYPVSLFEPAEVDKVIREAQLRSTGHLCFNCSRTPQLRRQSDQHFLIDIVPPQSPTHSDIVINIISPTPSPPPTGLLTAHGLQSYQIPFDDEFRHTPPPPDVMQSTIPVTDFMSPSPPSMELHASTSAAPIEMPLTTQSRGHSLAPSPIAQLFTPTSHLTTLSPAPSSPYASSPTPQPQPRKATARSPKNQATSSKGKKKKDTTTLRQQRAKSASTGRKPGLNLSAAQLARRQEIKDLAQAIVTTKNSPVNKSINKRALLHKVAHDIVWHPPSHWMNLIAVKIGRAPEQVRHWYNNRKQRLRDVKAVFGYEYHTLPSGEKVEIARECLSIAETQNFSWTDEQFERILDDCHDHSNQASAFSNWWPKYLWEQTVKYWCEDSQGVASGMVLKKRKVQPRALLGTYYWIWGGGMGADDQLAAQEDMEGHLTMTSESKKSHVALKDINATFQIGVMKGSFRGLKLQNRSTPTVLS
ncbi:hypothetical protein BDZ89DRAFT_1133151 [Hymenopellis radicata]|nr:hypothetical protein BDZ89DRAFT_1133151 [Hymenopellis radicata]